MVKQNDVFSFGAILLELIHQCRVDGLLEDSEDDGMYYLHQVAWSLYQHKKEGYEKSKFRFGKFKLSLVNKYLAVEPDLCPSDGPKLSKLAVECVDLYAVSRPTAKEIVEQFMKLKYFRRNGHKLGLRNMLDAGGSKSSIDGSSSGDSLGNHYDTDRSLRSES